MPRKYIKKKERSYTIDQLIEAIRRIKEKKISFRQAEAIYSIPRSTLVDQLKKEVITEPIQGAKPVFNSSQEKELENYILESCRVFYGVTIPQIRKIAYDYAAANRLKNNFNNEHKIAGLDWYYNFMRRHPNISLRRPEATSLNRVTAFNKEETQRFFTNLQDLMLKHKFRPGMIFNVDETGISNVQRNSKILAPKGQKQVGKCTSGERGSITTVINAFSASGNYVPPFFIFKRKRMNQQLMTGGNCDMVASISDSGWITGKLFVDWLHHINSYVKPSIDSPMLLILDNHESHVSLDAYEFCRKNWINLLSLPPHSSHRMQPLDLTFYGPLKNAYNKECESYMMNHPGRGITAFEIVGLFTKAFNRTANIEKAASGFRAAGIYPFDSERFNELIAVSTQSQAEETAASCHPPVTATINDSNIQHVAEVAIDSSQNDQNNSVILRDIVNVPQIKAKITSKRKKHSEILTSTPIKKQLEQKKQKQISKQEKEKSKQKENKPTKKPKIKKIKGLANLQGFEKIDEEKDEFFCIFCSEEYVSPPREDWIMCIICLKWAHENCTGGSSSNGSYICDICNDK